MNISSDKIDYLINKKIEIKINSVVNTFLKVTTPLVIALMSVLIYMYSQTAITIDELKENSINMRVFVETARVKEDKYLEEQFEIKQLIQDQRQDTKELFNFIMKNN